MEHWYDGWDEKVLPNETLDEYGQIINTETKKGFGQPDKTPLLPTVRKYDHPTVNKLREYLRVNNKGIHGLEMCEPHEIEKATRIFHRDGFVVIKNALSPSHLQSLKKGVEREVQNILQLDPKRRGNRGVNRYSFGGSSKTAHLLHIKEWVDLIDVPTITPILISIFCKLLAVI